MIEAVKRQAMQISVRTGLKESTCLDLLLSGWAFSQHKDSDPDRWVSSLGSVNLPNKK